MTSSIPNNHTDLINYLIEKHHYKSYLEIGVKDVALNFTHIKCPIKMGIDPHPRCANVTFEMTSDEAFQYLFPQMFDIVFIDGLHQEQQVDRDIDNSLNVLKSGGIIIMHDCNPVNEVHASEQDSGGVWNGSVYKSMIKIHQINPDCSFVLNFDQGCGIIYPTLAQKPIRMITEPLDICWDVFNSRRADLLGLKNIEDCLHLLE